MDDNPTADDAATAHDTAAPRTYDAVDQGAQPPRTGGDPLRRTMEHEAPQGFTDEDGYRYDLITAALGDAPFPATREQVLDRLRGRDVAEAVLVDLRSLPEGSRYDGPAALLSALGIGKGGRVDVEGAPPLRET